MKPRLMDRDGLKYARDGINALLRAMGRPHSGLRDSSYYADLSDALGRAIDLIHAVEREYERTEGGE
jgi:hypothetical protein